MLDRLPHSCLSPKIIGLVLDSRGDVLGQIAHSGHSLLKELIPARDSRN